MKRKHYLFYFTFTKAEWEAFGHPGKRAVARILAFLFPGILTIKIKD